MSDKEKIARLVKQVSLTISYERGAICAVDCLYQWEAGLLEDTILAWKRYLVEHRESRGHSETERYGAWVPAIPVKA